MTKSTIYEMDTLEQYKSDGNPITFVFSPNEENRSHKGIDYLLSNGSSIKQVLIITYDSVDLTLELNKKLSGIKITIINITSNPIEFVMNLKGVNTQIWENDVIFDISCVRIPEIFTLMKYFKLNIKLPKLNIIYSIPYDYNFTKEPFTSYRSFNGDLVMYELLGYSGSGNDDTENSDLFLFMGFEGSLALKVVENSVYRELKLINNLPSFYPKYKDISVINHYQLMQNQYQMLYTPADNPFETYNLLDNIVGSNSAVCIAPLSTKPVALGVCLFALDNDKARIVYPISQNYNRSNTLETYKTHLYRISL